MALGINNIVGVSGMFVGLVLGGLLGGLTAHGVPAGAAHHIAALPPVSILFAAFLGYNPIQHLVGPHVLDALRRTATARRSSGSGQRSSMHVEWFGQSPFALRAGDVTVAIDPFGPGSRSAAGSGGTTPPISAAS